MRQEIVVNGEPMPHERATLAELIADRVDTPSRGIAVALNDAVVRRAAWSQTRLRAGDRIEIIKVMVGG